MKKLGVKKVLGLGLGVALSLGASSAFAQLCGVDNAKVVSVFQWTDGSIFVEFDRSTGCGCSSDNRLSFHKNSNEKFLMNASLTALATGKKVMAKGTYGNCPVHGNTSKMVVLQVKDH